MRAIITFACERETLVGTLDAAGGRTGVLIVSGGNELRMGAHRGMAMLAARLRAQGVPVLRFDRRGIGDSTGDNHGFDGSAADLAAAAAAFRAAAPTVTKVVGLGNCDAASALALHGAAAGIDAIILTNPWLAPEPDDLPPAAAIRVHYVRRIANPGTWRRLLAGGIDLRKAIRGLRKAGVATRSVSPILDALAGWNGRATVILARHDATAIAYADAASVTSGLPAPHWIETDSHSFARSGDAMALDHVIRASLSI